MTNANLRIVGWYGAFFLATLIPALIPFCGRAWKHGIRNIWRIVQGPTLVLGIFVIPGVLAVVAGTIEGLFRITIPSIIVGLVALFNGYVFLAMG